MLGTEHFRRRWRAYTFVVFFVAMTLLMAYTGHLSDVATSLLVRFGPPSVTHSGDVEYYGEESLEERIAGADVIARVRLRSVSQVVEFHDYTVGETAYTVALEFSFDVVEYLKGTGSSTLVAVAYDIDVPFKTKLGATTLGENLLAQRNSTWDDRDAIVFLADNHPSLPSTKAANRYWMGILRYNGEDRYTIASRHARHWLPAEKASGSLPSTASADPSFLLGVPSAAEATAAVSAYSSSTTTAATIRLSQLKSRIASIATELNAGDGSQEYRRCLYLKYERQRHQRYTRNWLAKQDLPRGSHENHAFTSGHPAGTHIYADKLAPYLQQYAAEPPNGGEGTFGLLGQDGKLFTARWPGVISSARPLPKGEYRYHFAHRSADLVVCDGWSDIDKLNELVVITVTAPAGALHEAFFDPIYATSSGEYRADASLGVLKPAGYRKAGDTATTTIHSIAWKAQQATLTTSPGALPANHHVDFIALDGSVSLRLDVDTATTTTSGGKHTLSWRICRQPWHAGDKLMLRIAQSGANSSGATNDAACTTPNPKPTPTPVATTTPPVATPAPTPVPLADPPQVSGFSASSAGGGITLSWQSRTGVAKYRLTELVGIGEWQTIRDSLTSHSHTETGLECGWIYDYRISAYGDGTTYAAKWGPQADAWATVRC